ncbi:MAG TPA: choice-of-anchor Q domain-containing protein [Thermoleophilaceae bacterium]|nr:choice-of-anchor Q domain-containing protein [Thermoleophilaceae bacterium]
MRYPFALLAAVAALLLLAAPAAAVNVHVDVTNDEDDGACAAGDCSLREAVKYGPNAATVDVPGGTYTLASELLVEHWMTIDGAGRASTKITAGGTHRTIRDTGGPVTIRDLTVTGGNGNGAGFGGGILDTSHQLLTLDNVRVTENSADLDTGNAVRDGGAGVGADGPVTVRSSLIDQNSAFLQAGESITNSGGAGIFVADGALTVIDSEIRDNHLNVQGAKAVDASVAGNGGGGIFVTKDDGTPSLTVTRSTVAGNSVGVAGQTKVEDNGGGGIYVNLSAATLVNSTVSDNDVAVPAIPIDNGGGGVFLSGADGSLVNTTLSNNQAQSNMMDAGGAVYRDRGGLSARNTIIAHNDSDLSGNCFGAIVSEGRNVEDEDSCGLRGTGDRVATPIDLGPLAANGGPTRTRAIFAGGPAFDTATDCPPRDQRGFARPAGAGCDRGAFEIALPVVQTGGVRKVGTGGARLLGSLNPNGGATTFLFQFGKTRAYGRRTESKGAGDGRVAKAAAATIGGLDPATIYHYRLVGKSSLGTSRGRDRSFVTHMKLPSGCVEDGRLTVPLGRPAGTRVVSASASIGGKQVGAAGGNDVKRLKLTDLPGKEFRLKVVATLKDGRRVLGSRRYKPCS